MSIKNFEGESDTYMKCEVKIDASVEECASYSFSLMSRKRMRMNDTKNVLLREVSEQSERAFGETNILAMKCAKWQKT